MNRTADDTINFSVQPTPGSATFTPWALVSHGATKIAVTGTARMARAAPPAARGTGQFIDVPLVVTE